VWQRSDAAGVGTCGGGGSAGVSVAGDSVAAPEGVPVGPCVVGAAAGVVSDGPSTLHAAAASTTTEVVANKTARTAP
jgi:hypothetical protein